MAKKHWTQEPGNLITVNVETQEFIIEPFPTWEAANIAKLERSFAKKGARYPFTVSRFVTGNDPDKMLEDILGKHPNATLVDALV